jgi:fumarate reductase subunit C
MPIQLGEMFVPGPVIVIGHYVVWLALSLVILYMGGVIHG